MTFMLEYKKVTWWYWLVSALCVSVGVFGNSFGFYFLIVLCFIQLVHFGIEDKTIQSFTVQMRLVMLGLSLLFYFEPLRILYWIPFFGLWANVVFGYCLLARIMALMPWNRKEAFSFDLMKRTIFSPPVRGCILVKGIPCGYHAVTPSFTFKDSRQAIEFYKKAFGAKNEKIFPTLDGKGVMHATIEIGDSIIMMGDEMPGMSCKSAETTGTSPIGLFLYVTDADAVFKQAVSAGAKADMPMYDAFWGDRCGHVTDPFGYSWMIATHKRDLTPAEITEGARVFFANLAASKK